MSSWNDSTRWHRYLSKEGCLVCNQTPETRPPTERSIAPRQMGDPFENGPVDWRTRSRQLYGDGEFEAFIERMKTAVRDIEQGAAADAVTRRR